MPDEDVSRPDVIPVGGVRFGDLRRTEPISTVWGFDRGSPVDRHYIEEFLAQHAADIRGRVLEVGDPAYTLKFGGDRVIKSDVLNVAAFPGTTIEADLAWAPHIPTGSFDCIICTQTLQLIYDLPAAIGTMHRILRPGGVLLVTVPGITHTGDGQWGSHWCWTFTRVSAALLCREFFDPDRIAVTGYGNVLAAIAFLHGLASAELRAEELAVSSAAYDVTIGVRAVKKD